MLIVGRPSADRRTVKNNLNELGANRLFLVDMLDALWEAALYYHLDPVGMVAQSFKETGAGKFGGRIDHRWFNTCGLKVRDQRIHPELDGDKPLAHAMFPNWQVGAEAHAQHLRAYAGWPVDGHMIVDPRYVWVIGKHQVTKYEDLGGKWAPNKTYGKEIVTIANKLKA